MKYTTEEALSEILRRSERIAIRRNRRVYRALSSTACVLFASLLLVICTLPEQSIKASSDTVYGAFLLSPEAGGYVLAVVIAFSLGVAVTLLCVLRQRWGGKHGSNQPDVNKFTRNTKGEQHETHSKPSAGPGHRSDPGPVHERRRVRRRQDQSHHPHQPQ